LFLSLEKRWLKKEKRGGSRERIDGVKVTEERIVEGEEVVEGEKVVEAEVVGEERYKERT